MKVIFMLFFYHIFLIILGLLYFYFYSSSDLFLVFELHSVWVHVGLFGLTGCCTYCIRSLYLQYCVKKDWNNRWIVWHIIRPFVGFICGVISLLFIKAGLLLLEVSHTETQSYYGVYALAFISGLNIDNFIKKIESVFQEVIGIQKTRTSEER